MVGIATGRTDETSILTAGAVGGKWPTGRYCAISTGTQYLVVGVLRLMVRPDSAPPLTAHAAFPPSFSAAIRPSRQHRSPVTVM